MLSGNEQRGGAAGERAPSPGLLAQATLSRKGARADTPPHPAEPGRLGYPLPRRGEGGGAPSPGLAYAKPPSPARGEGG